MDLTADLMTNFNPLVGLADPIFNFITQLTYTTKPIAHLPVHHHLVTMLHRFEQQAEQAGYSPNLIIVARDCLCCLLDEAMLTNITAPDVQQWWQHHQLLHLLHKNITDSSITTGSYSWHKFIHWWQKNYWFGPPLSKKVHGAQYFFQLIAQTMNNPPDTPEIFELFYLCLSFGFKGAYRSQKLSQQQELRLLKNRLYQLIVQERQRNGQIAANELLISSEPDPVTLSSDQDRRVPCNPLGFLLRMQPAYRYALLIGSSCILAGLLQLASYLQLRGLIQENIQLPLKIILVGNQHYDGVA